MDVAQALLQPSYSTLTSQIRVQKTLMHARFPCRLTPIPFTVIQVTVLSNILPQQDRTHQSACLQYLFLHTANVTCFHFLLWECQPQSTNFQYGQGSLSYAVIADRPKHIMAQQENSVLLPCLNVQQAGRSSGSSGSGNTAPSILCFYNLQCMAPKVNLGVLSLPVQKRETVRKTRKCHP